MKTDLGLLEIKKMIIHEVPRKASGGGQASNPVYSEVESPLTNDLVIFFRGKIIESSGSSNAFEVCLDDNSSSPIPKLINTYLTNTGVDFVDISQKIAKHLCDCQTAVNPGGLITVVDCVFGSCKAIAILKVEKEAGVRLNQSKVNGKTTFNIRYIKDLIFSKKTKLFKSGLFIQIGAKMKTIEGLVCDQQRSRFARNEVAMFFLNDFLGCQMLQDPAVATKHFFEAAEEFINAEIAEPVKRTVAHNHLLSEVTSQKQTINPDSFANDYLPVDLRQKFVASLSEKGLANKSFGKNIELIEKKIQKIIMEFESGISVVGKTEAINEKVEVSELENGNTKLQLIDKLSKVRSK